MRYRLALGGCVCAAALLFAADDVSLANLLPAAEKAETARTWTWDELARRASERADAAKVQFIRAAAKRQQVDADLAWKDPQLRLGHTWENGRDHESGTRPEHDDGGTYTLGARFYIANPFVNRYIRRAGDAQVEALEARAKTEQYAVYCEVKSLCLEEARLRREQDRRQRASELWEKVRLCLEGRLQQGVEKSPLDVVRAEVAREKAREQAEAAAQERRQVRRQIAFYTGIPEQSLKIRYTPPEPPTTNRAFAVTLQQAALARRPDLVGARAELAAARANTDRAKAAYLPWFNFVEGTYSHQSSDSTEWGSGGRSHTHGRENDYQIRVALDVPIFTWLGGSVSALRDLEELNDARVKGLSEAVQTEIEGALDAYYAADARFVRLSDAGGAFVKRMKARLEEFAATPAVKPDDIYRVQLELLDYLRFKDEAESAWISRILLLETVSGGPLPYEAK